MKIAIVVALQTEFDLVKNIFTSFKEVENRHITFFKGDISGKEVALMKCGIGKVNAAVRLSELINVFAPDMVVNTGVAGGIDTEVTSPTFSVMQSYGDKIYHYDIYQNGLDAILQNGLFENLLEEGLHLVEWGDERLEKALANLGEKCVKVVISPSQKGRKYEVYGA